MFGIQILKKLFGKQTGMSNTSNFWLLVPMITFVKRTSPLLEDVPLFHQQMQEITDRMLLNAAPSQVIHQSVSGALSQFKWVPGAVVAGSSIMNIINSGIPANDVDIYVKTKEDAKRLLLLNQMKTFPYESEFCTVGAWQNIQINIIWGIKFDTARDLIAGFDMRCCAVAIDAISGEFFHVDGAIEDCQNKRVIFQTNPRTVSLYRLLKYVGKNFTVDKYQRTVLAELIKSGKHDNNLELTTGYGESK